MRKLIASEWVTLDGVFDGDTMDEWFNPYDSEERQAFIREMVLGSNDFVLGRVTYEMLGPYWSALKKNEMGIADRMNSATKHVVSATLRKAEWSPSSIIKENVAEEIAKLKQKPGQDILIFGSATLVQSLMKTDLIDELWVLVQPIVMGHGKRLFMEGTASTKLELVKSKTFKHGVTMLSYKPARL